MITFNQELKDQWIATMQAHQDADRLIQGQWINGDVGGMKSGCFFGCAMQTEDNVLESAAQEMQLPLWLVYLSEKIFEGLGKKESITFPVRLLKAIPFDSDIDDVKHVIAINRLQKFLNKDFPDEVKNAITMVIDCHKNPLNSDWSAARSAAWSVAWSAAESAARSAAWSAADSAARSAAWSVAWSAAESAAESAAWSVAWSAAESAAESSWSAESEQLLSALSGAGIEQ